jgi:hypothetical protein
MTLRKPGHARACAAASEAAQPLPRARRYGWALARRMRPPAKASSIWCAKATR